VSDWTDAEAWLEFLDRTPPPSPTEWTLLLVGNTAGLVYPRGADTSIHPSHFRRVDVVQAPAPDLLAENERLRAQRDEARALLVDAVDYVQELKTEVLLLPPRLSGWLADVDEALEDERRTDGPAGER
jgi:hypothetical protein